MKKRIILITLFSIFSFFHISAETFFSGYAGGKLTSSIDNTDNIENPGFQDAMGLKLQTFFAGQLNFSKNTWAHLEASIDTEDLLSDSIFKTTDSHFQIDELSFIIRIPILNTTNYFGTYIGTYDPIGSDIFLQRYLNSEPITSKLTDSWLGMANAIIYPHWGTGISNIVRLNALPIAFGGYLYMNLENNKEFENYWQTVADLRFACLFRYFTFDFSAGLGTPIINNPVDGYIYAVDRINFHMGTNILIGNSYTHSFFLQGGIYNMEFTKNYITPEDFYLLLEPRFIIEKLNIHLTLYSMPEKCISNFSYIDNTFGLNLNFLMKDFYLINNKCDFGLHLTFGLIDKNLTNAFADFKSEDIDIGLMPYFSTDFLTGTLQAQLKLRLLKFAKWDSPVSLDIGFKTQF